MGLSCFPIPDILIIFLLIFLYLPWMNLANCSFCCCPLGRWIWLGMGRITVVQISTTSAEWFPISARLSELLQSSSDFPLVSFLSHSPRQLSKILSFHSILYSKPSYLIEEIEITRLKLVLQFFFSSALNSFIKMHSLSGVPLATEEMALFTPKAVVLFCRILPLLFL